MNNVKLLLTILNFFILFLAGVKMTHRVFFKYQTPEDMTGVNPLAKLDKTINRLNHIEKQGIENPSELTKCLLDALVNLKNFMVSSESSLSADRKRAGIGLFLLLVSSLIQIWILYYMP